MTPEQKLYELCKILEKTRKQISYDKSVPNYNTNKYTQGYVDGLEVSMNLISNILYKD